MPKAGELKDLEALILGVVAECQPCSPYYVHKAFFRSPSQFFSGSAGAIYPAVKRLEKRGLLKSTRSGSRGKPSKSLTVTEAGMKELSVWYFNPLRAGDAGYDPLRSRISILAALPPGDRPKVLASLTDICRGRLEILEGLDLKPIDGAWMDRAVEIEKATVKAKLGLLLEWQKKAR